MPRQQPQASTLEAQLAAIVQSSDDAIIGTLTDGTIESWNGAAEQIFGWSADEAIGRSIEILVPDDRLGELAEVRAAVERAVATAHFETVGRRRDGQLVPVSLAVSPIADRERGVVGASYIARDITQQQHAREEGLWLAAIVRSSDDAIVSKNLNGIITSWNPAAERMFGWTADEVIGKSILIIVPDNRRDEETFVLSRIRAGLAVEHFETVRQRKDGTLIDISLSVSPVKTPDGRVVGASKIARDITENKRLIQAQRDALVREREIQAEANRVKDEFLATLSHELRTPLNAIIGWSDLLMEGTLDGAEYDVALETIHRNARVQVQLVEDLLDISRIVSGKVRLETTAVDLVDVVGNAIDVVRPAAGAKQIAIHTEWRAPQLWVTGDADRLQQVIWNLLSNAVKFTPAGGSVTIVGEREGGRSVRLIVTDTGAGIPASFLPHVFERFRQENSAHTRAHGGLGLGLAIVRELVELHGGTVEAASGGENLGATFTMTLPARAAARSTQKPAASAATHAHALHGLRLLVVDDQPDERRLLRTMLSSDGAQVRTASSAADGKRQILEWRPDALVSDIAMPGEDGHTLAKWVRSTDEIKSMPCIALTAHARTEDRRAAFEAGFNHYVAKPVDRSRLVEVIRSATRKAVKIA